MCVQPKQTRDPSPHPLTPHTQTLRRVLLVSRRDITASSRVEDVLLGVTETQLHMVSNPHLQSLSVALCVLARVFLCSCTCWWMWLGLE